jgi:transcriptional regulator with XRE-family HTH domain
MPSPDEKKAFSRRLALALRRAPEPVEGATELALRFNLRHTGAAVSPQTAHKWLSGRAIPTADKLATLAEWLNVSEHWLHYGPPPASNPGATEQSREPYASSPRSAKPGPDALALAGKIQSLSAHRRYLLEELVEQLLRDGG